MSLPLPHPTSPLLFSLLQDDGRQPTAINLRDDCVTETAMAFAARSVVRAKATASGTNRPDLMQNGSATDAAMSRNLLNYAWVHGGFPQVRRIQCWAASALMD